MELASLQAEFSQKLSLDWSTQKTKEDLLTLVAHEGLRRHLPASLSVTPLKTFEEQKRGDFRLQNDKGLSQHVECKFEDYPDTWFPEVAQYVKRATADADGQIELGWCFKSSATWLLYVSPVTGLAVLVDRERVLNIQMALLQALLLLSTPLDIPVMLNAALNPSAKGSQTMSRAGIGLGLDWRMILRRYGELHGTEGLALLDFRPELRALQQACTDNLPDWEKWAKDKLLSEPFPDVLNNGLSIEAAGSPVLCTLFDRVRNEQPLSPESELSLFFLHAARRCVSGQTWLADSAQGRYRLCHPLQPAKPVAVWTPLPSKAFQPGQAGCYGVRRVQRELSSACLSVLRQSSIDKAALNHQRRQYLKRVFHLETPQAPGPGQRCSVAVAWAPLQAGSLSAQVRVTSNAQNGLQEISLEGDAFQPPAAVFNQSGVWLSGGTQSISEGGRLFQASACRVRGEFCHLRLVPHLQIQRKVVLGSGAAGPHQ